MASTASDCTTSGSWSSCTTKKRRRSRRQAWYRSEIAAVKRFADRARPPTATPTAGSKVLYNETIVVPASGYVNYKMTLDYQKSVNISIKTDGGPIDCIVVYDSALEAYKDNLAGTMTYFGYQKLYPSIVDASNTFTSTNTGQVYYIILDNTGKAGEANAGRDVNVHIKVEQL